MNTSVMYTEAMKEIAANNKVLFIDALKPSSEWFASSTDSPDD